MFGVDWAAVKTMDPSCFWEVGVEHQDKTVAATKNKQKKKVIVKTKQKHFPEKIIYTQ